MLKSVTYKDQFLKLLFSLELFPPKVITKFERGSIHFHLFATKESYDKLGIKKAASNRAKHHNKCPLCKIWKNAFSKMFYHVVSVDHNVPSFVIKNTLELIEKQNLELQLGDRI